MKRAVGIFNIAGLGLGLYFMVNAFLPNSIWFDVREVRVLDTDYGQPVTIVADRDINREFFGTYSVVVREAGDSAPVCSLLNGGGFTYEVNLNDLDERVPLGPKTLDWWSDGECKGSHLQPGFYTITTDWVIRRPWPFTEGHVTVRSNVFEVRPK